MCWINKVNWIITNKSVPLASQCWRCSLITAEQNFSAAGVVEWLQCCGCILHTQHPLSLSSESESPSSPTSTLWNSELWRLKGLAIAEEPSTYRSNSVTQTSVRETKKRLSETEWWDRERESFTDVAIRTFIWISLKWAFFYFFFRTLTWTKSNNKTRQGCLAKLKADCVTRLCWKAVEDDEREREGYRGKIREKTASEKQRGAVRSECQLRQLRKLY